MGKKKRAQESKWAENRLGVLGVICAVAGLIVFPLPLGIVAVVFGRLNMIREEVSLWKLALPVGVLNILFGVFVLVGGM